MCQQAEGGSKDHTEYLYGSYHLNDNVGIAVSLIKIHNFWAQFRRHLRVHLITCVQQVFGKFHV